MQSYDDILEPKLEEVLNQLKEISGSLGHWLIDHLTSRLSSLSSPDDLFTFFTEMRGWFLFFFFFIKKIKKTLNQSIYSLLQAYKLVCFISGILGGSDSVVIEDNQVILDPNSNLGMFLRRCILAFNLLSFEVFFFIMYTNFTFIKPFVTNIIQRRFLFITKNFMTFDFNAGCVPSFDKYRDLL